MKCKQCKRITKKSTYLKLLDMLIKNQQDHWNGNDGVMWLLKKEAQYTNTTFLRQ